MTRSFDAIVMGVSAGGLAALTAILPRLSPRMAQPILIVQHLRADSDDFLPLHFDNLCALRVKEAEDKEPIEKGTIYFAPANYHMMVEADNTIALSTAERVQYSRPAVDVLFETAAEVFQERLVGVVLTGANSDGTQGIQRIRELKGYAIVQSPQTAESAAMPRSVIQGPGADIVLDLDRIAPFINKLMSGTHP